jgi:hypothetical protein
MIPKPAVGPSLGSRRYDSAHEDERTRWATLPMEIGKATPTIIVLLTIWQLLQC